jgi:ProP effector
MSHDLTEKLAKLAALYPKTFFVREQDRRPLKLGIHRDLNSDTTHGLSSNDVRQVVGQYCSSAGYLASCTEGAERIGLDGEVTGTVTAEAVQKMHCAQQAKAEKKAVVAVERQTRKPAAPAPTTASAARIAASNANGKRITLSDLRAAARQRQGA